MTNCQASEMQSLKSRPVNYSYLMCTILFSRVKKVSNTRMYAFDSPNFPPLLEAKTTLQVDPKMLIYPLGAVPNECKLHDQLSKKVYILKVAPNITPEIMRAVFEEFEGKKR